MKINSTFCDSFILISFMLCADPKIKKFSFNVYDR